MDNIIKLAEALGWPIASTAIAVLLFLIVHRVTATKGEVSIGIKDWLKFGSKPPSQPVPALPTPSPENEAAKADETTAETVAEVAEDSAENASSTVFWIADSGVELERRFAKFKDESTSYRDDPEFWESVRVDRRRELSIGDEQREFTQLAEQNKTWVWPLIFLLRRHVRLHDSASAEAVLNSALNRSNLAQHRWVLRDGVTFYYRLFGLERALEFIREQLNLGKTDLESAAMLNQLGELSNIDADPFSSMILRELALRHDNSQQNTLFDIGFKYGFHNNFGPIAFQRYNQISDTTILNAPNNMGVIVGKTNEAVEYEFFETALELGSGVAAANLARSLVDDGFVRRAEIVLEKPTDVNLSSEDAKTLADARSKVATARAAMEKAKAKFEEYSREQDRRYVAALLAAYAHFRESGSLHTLGQFESSDKSLLVVADAEGAVCTYKIGDTTFNGKLARKPLCYEGVVTSAGKAILDQSDRRLLVLQVGQDLLRVVIWPDLSTAADPLRIVDAARIVAQEVTTPIDPTEA